MLILLQFRMAQWTPFDDFFCKGKRIHLLWRLFLNRLGHFHWNDWVKIATFVEFLHKIGKKCLFQKCLVYQSHGRDYNPRPLIHQCPCISTNCVRSNENTMGVLVRWPFVNNLAMGWSFSMGVCGVTTLDHGLMGSGGGHEITSHLMPPFLLLIFY